MMKLIPSLSLGLAIAACSVETVKAPVAAEPSANSPEEPGLPPSGGSDADESDATHPPATKDAGTRDANATKPDSSCATKRWYQDSDHDGFGDATKFTDSCDEPSGYVADKTDCDDTNASIKPGAVELCDAIDNDCDRTVNGTPTEAAACTEKAGSYAGTFTLYTAEKVGSTIVNQMKCTGTVAIAIDLAAAVVVKGTATCAYAGSLGGFDRNQSSTIEATVRPDGTLEGTLTHTFESFGSPRTFDIKGTAVDGRIDVTQATSWYPRPTSAVPWELTITIAAPKT